MFASLIRQAIPFMTSCKFKAGIRRSSVFGWIAFSVLAAAAIPARGQTPTDIYNFKGDTGDVANTQPYGVMVQARDGNLYSAAPNGGGNSDGGIFMVTPSGTENVIHSFQNSDGSSCQPGLNLGTDGNLYGTCYFGGSGFGTVYKATTGGSFAVLHAFTGGSDQGYPNGPPIQAKDGNLYGTDGTNSANGIVYKLTSSGVLTPLHSFTGGADGYGPSAPLVQGSDGNLYGSTQFGSTGGGTIFKISTKGKLTTLHSFSGGDGNRPISAMVQGTDGNFYGTTYQGGTNNLGVIFRISASGKFALLHSFSGAADGQNPEVAMLQATDGNFYGVALFGGNAGGWQNNGQGSIFKLTLKGVFSVLYLFDGSVGSNPGAALVQHTNGLLYGDTYTGSGTGQSNGIAYSLNIGAKPFAKLAVTSGIEGTSVGIYGQGFSSATGVTFGGVSASFTTAGDNYLTATVPPNALTGSVVVDIPSGNLTSSAIFHVTPTLKSFSPTSGPVGTPVTITGTGLLQTTTVTFGGVKATTFTVNSDTQVTADVPTGAKTGKIGIATKGGKVTSKASFTVTP